MTRPTPAREEAEQSPLDIAMDALYEVRRAIFNADPKVLTCTLWMPTDTYSGGTVVDFIENEMERVRALRPSAEAGGVEAVAVKALEWNPFSAETVIGRYDIVDQSDASYAREREGRQPFLLAKPRAGYARFDTLAEARAVAQADFEQRIRSALSPAATPRSEAGGDVTEDRP